MKHDVQIEDWELLDYQEAWDRQTALHKALIADKRAENVEGHPGYLVLCEHPAVYTLGKSGSEDHLLIDQDDRERLGLQFYKINRGGDITHHGPGQLVGYPILDLEYWYRDVHRYVREIEQVIIDTLATFDIIGLRLEGYTGVWTKDKDGIHKKLCAIGVHLSRWVSMHGFALNVNNDLNLFKHIVPCGIQESGKEVTSMSELKKEIIPVHDVKQEIASNFARIFNCRLIETDGR